LLENVAVPAVRSAPRAVLATDASSVGWGAVLACDGELRFWGGPWSLEDAALHINAKELVALRKGLPALPPSRAAVIVLDSRVAHGVLVRGYAASPELNAVATDIFRIRELDQDWLIWVPSDRNPADAPSRLDPDAADSVFARWKVLEDEMGVWLAGGRPDE